MPELLQGTDAAGHPELSVLFLRLSLAAVFGFAVAGVYALTQRRSPGHILPMVTTLVLLTILVAMTTIVIGDSIARAFGLVGALSIVRFRTVVDDTRDTSFVIFAVVTGMAMGAGNLYICLVGVPLVSLVAYLLSAAGPMRMAMANAIERRLEIRISQGRDPELLLANVFTEHLRTHRLVNIVSARQGTAIDLHYRVQLLTPEGLLPLVKAIQSVEGIQGVECKEV